MLPVSCSSHSFSSSALPAAPFLITCFVLKLKIGRLPSHYWKGEAAERTHSTTLVLLFTLRYTLLNLTSIYTFYMYKLYFGCICRLAHHWVFTPIPLLDSYTHLRTLQRTQDGIDPPRHRKQPPWPCVETGFLYLHIWKVVCPPPLWVTVVSTDVHLSFLFPLWNNSPWSLTPLNPVILFLNQATIL